MSEYLDLDRYHLETESLPTICKATGCTNTAEKGQRYCDECIIKQDEKAAANLDKFKGVVYFIRGDITGHIKIGFSKYSGEERIKSLKTGASEPIKVLCSIPGGKWLEKKLHKIYSDFLVKGEWFMPAPTLIALITAIKSDNSFYMRYHREDDYMKVALDKHELKILRDSLAKLDWNRWELEE